jgi:hypothetical protein
MRNRRGSIKHLDNAGFSCCPQGFGARGEPLTTLDFPPGPEDACTVAVSWPAGLTPSFLSSLAAPRKAWPDSENPESGKTTGFRVHANHIAS